LNDHDQLRHDPIMAVLAGKLEAGRADCAPLAGKSTLNQGIISATSAAALTAALRFAATARATPTGAANAAVSQLVGGVTYRLQCVATTSDGQSLSLWTHLTCQAPA
jgi:hypothetical protein